MKHFCLLRNSFLSMAFMTFLLVSCASTPSIPPSVQQSLTDAKALLEQAKSAQAEKYAQDYVFEAEKSIKLAEEGIKKNDLKQTNYATDIAKAYAHLAKSEAELKRTREELASWKEKIVEVENRIIQLQKTQ